MTPLLLATAEKYHGLGANITAVASKRPAHKWQDWQTNRQSVTDVKKLAMWDNDSTTGVGVISGVNGWRVIDIDKCNDPCAVEMFLAKLGLPADYKWVVRTGSGNGYHIWFRCAELLPTDLAPDDKGVIWFLPPCNPGPFFEFDHFELRWENCQTLLPPSKHPTGPGYQWFNGEPAEPPALVPVDRVTRAAEVFGIPKQNAKTGPPAPKLTPVDHSPNYLNGTVAEIKSRLDIVTEAQRLFAGDMQAEPGGQWRITGHGGLIIKPDTQVFYNFLEESGGDVLDLYGLAEYGPNWDNHNPAMFKAAMEKAAAVAGVDLGKAEPGKVADSAQPKKSLNVLFPHYTLSSGLQMPKTDYLVYGAIGATDIGMIYGDSASGKTYLSVDLAVSMAAGLPWMGRWKVSKPRKVLYFISEGQRHFFRRVLAAVNGMGTRGYDPTTIYQLVEENMVIVTVVPQLFDQTAARSVNAYLQYWYQAGSPDIDFIFIDTLHRASVGSEENAAKDAGVVVDNFTRLKNEINAAAAVVHHSNKTGGYRGSTAYRGNVDFVFKVEGVHREPRRLTIDKLRDGEYDGPVEGMSYVSMFRVDDASTGTYASWLSDDDAGEYSEPDQKAQAKMEILQALKDGSVSKRHLAEQATTVCKNTAMQYINSMIKAGEIVTQPGTRNSLLCSLPQLEG